MNYYLDRSDLSCSLNIIKKNRKTEKINKKNSKIQQKKKVKKKLKQKTSLNKRNLIVEINLIITVEYGRQ